MSYEKWKEDQDYLTQLKDVKESVEIEYELDSKKFEVPPQLTKEKTLEIITKKGHTLNDILKMSS